MTEAKCQVRYTDLACSMGRTPTSSRGRLADSVLRNRRFPVSVSIRVSSVASPGSSASVVPVNKASLTEDFQDLRLAFGGAGFRRRIQWRLQFEFAAGLGGDDDLGEVEGEVVR